MDSASNKSLWLATYGPYTPNEPLRGERRVDVAVVGGGFTGLATAYNVCREAPGTRVTVLEGEVVGFGASGRNGGFSMTLFGLEPTVTQAFFGPQRTVEAQHYMERAVDYVDELVKRHSLQSDYEFPGFIRAATTPAYARRIQHDLDILTSRGVTGITWLDADAVRAQVDSPRFLGGWWEPRCGLLNPAKQVRELKRIAQEAGAVVYEHSPALSIERGPRFIVRTPAGLLIADKLVLATNAYSHLIPELRAKQVPVFTHMIATERLSPAQLETIGWRNRQGLEDARNLVHYFRLTADNRLTIGGSDVSIAYGRDMNRDLNPHIFADLERQVTWLFPGLKGIRITHRWGGPVSVPVDMAPIMGNLGDDRVWYSLGCVGHGVSMTHLNGRALADLVLGRRTDLTEAWFINRRVIPWPPEPLRLAASHVIRGALRLQDALDERDLKREPIRR